MLWRTACSIALGQFRARAGLTSAAPARGRSAHDLRQRGGAGGAAAGAWRRRQRAEGCQERPRLRIAARVAKGLRTCSNYDHVPGQLALFGPEMRLPTPLLHAKAAHAAPAGSHRRGTACITQSEAPSPGSCPSWQPRHTIETNFIGQRRARLQEHSSTFVSSGPKRSASARCAPGSASPPAAAARRHGSARPRRSPGGSSSSSSASAPSAAARTRASSSRASCRGSEGASGTLVCSQYAPVRSGRVQQCDDVGQRGTPGTLGGNAWLCLLAFTCARSSNSKPFHEEHAPRAPLAAAPLRRPRARARAPAVAAASTCRCAPHSLCPAAQGAPNDVQARERQHYTAAGKFHFLA